MKNMLVCLEKCTKCDQAKELMNKRTDVMIITLPHELDKWSDIQKTFFEKFKLMEDIKTTAPIFIDSEGKRLLGFLRIKKWVQDNPEKADRSLGYNGA